MYSPVDDAGRFTLDVEHFSGMEVFEANRSVIDKLTELGALVKEQKITHEYPHCWRCKKPVIFPFYGTVVYFHGQNRLEGCGPQRH